MAKRKTKRKPTKRKIKRKVKKHTTEKKAPRLAKLEKEALVKLGEGRQTPLRTNYLRKAGAYSRLERRGLARRQSRERGGKLEHTYSITKEGRNALRRVMADSPGKQKRALGHYLKVHYGV
jgi:hypothetical protein